MFTQVELKDVDHLNDVTEVYAHVYSVNGSNYSILGTKPKRPTLKTTFARNG